MKFINYSLKVAAILGLLIFSVLTYYSWRYTTVMTAIGEHLSEEKDSLISHILFTALALLLVGGIQKLSGKVTEKQVRIFAVAVSILITGLLLWWVKSAEAYPVADQGSVYHGAVFAVDGEYPEMGQGGYFYMYPFQLSLVFLYSVIFKLSGCTDPIIIQYVQAFFVGIAIYAGSEIAGEVFGSIKVKLSYLLIAIFCFPLLFYTLYVYGETAGVASASVFIWMLVLVFKNMTGERTGKLKKRIWVIAAVAFLIAYNVRVMLTIVWIAAFIITILLCIKNKRVLPVFMILLILFIAAGSQKLVCRYYENCADTSFNNGMSSWLWIAMGMQYDKEPGAFNDYNTNTYREAGGNTAKADETAKEYISERLEELFSDPGESFSFYKKKTLNQWNEPSYGVFFMTHVMINASPLVKEVYFGRFWPILYQFMNYYQALCYLAIVAVIVALLSGKHSIYQYLHCVILIGGFLFSLIWEAKSRYIFPSLVFSLPYMAGGLVIMSDSVRKVRLGIWNRFKHNF